MRHCTFSSQKIPLAHTCVAIIQKSKATVISSLLWAYSNARRSTSERNDDKWPGTRCVLISASIHSRWSCFWIYISILPNARFSLPGNRSVVSRSLAFVICSWVVNESNVLARVLVSAMIVLFLTAVLLTWDGAMFEFVPSSSRRGGEPMILQMIAVLVKLVQRCTCSHESAAPHCNSHAAWYWKHSTSENSWSRSIYRQIVFLLKIEVTLQALIVSCM